MKQLITLILLPALVTNCAAKDKKLKQVNIPGTHVCLTPPPVYELPTNLTGLVGPNYQVLVTDDTMLNYPSVASSLTPYAYKASGMEVYDYVDTMVAGYHAKFFHMGGAKAKIYTLVFGDTSFCAQVLGIYPPDEKDTAGRLKDIVLSVTYDRSIKIDPMEIAWFNLDVSKSRYKFYAKTSYAYVYAVEGQDTATRQGFLVSQVPADASTVPAAMNDMLISRFEEEGFTGKEYKTMSTDRVNGYKAYEAEIYGYLEGKRMLLYQLIVVHEEKALMMQGIAFDELEQNVEDFKRLAHTVRFK